MGCRAQLDIFRQLNITKHILKAVAVDDARQDLHANSKSYKSNQISKLRIVVDAFNRTDHLHTIQRPAKS